MTTWDKALVSLLLGLAAAFLITPDVIFDQILQTLSPDSRCPLVMYKLKRSERSKYQRSVFSSSYIRSFILILGLRGCHRHFRGSPSGTKQN